MKAVDLAFQSLRRIVRRRVVAAVMIALPLTCGIARAAFPDSGYSLGFVWACPFVCAMAACAVVVFQRVVDDTTGLTDALRNSPVGDRGLLISRLLAAFLLMLPPIIILALVLWAM